MAERIAVDWDPPLWLKSVTHKNAVRFCLLNETFRYIKLFKKIIFIFNYIRYFLGVDRGYEQVL